MKSEKITIQKDELPKLKDWAKRNNKEIIKIIELEKNSIRVIVKSN